MKNKLKLTPSEKKRKKWIYWISKINKQYTPDFINKHRQILNQENWFNKKRDKECNYVKII